MTRMLDEAEVEKHHVAQVKTVLDKSEICTIFIITLDHCSFAVSVTASFRKWHFEMKSICTRKFNMRMALSCQNHTLLLKAMKRWCQYHHSKIVERVSIIMNCFYVVTNCCCRNLFTSQSDLMIFDA